MKIEAKVIDNIVSVSYNGEVALRIHIRSNRPFFVWRLDCPVPDINQNAVRAAGCRAMREAFPDIL